MMFTIAPKRPGNTINSRHRGGNIGRHSLPTCQTTGLPRYRDRHQARAGAASADAGRRDSKTHAFACPDCRGYHLESMKVHADAHANDQAPPALPHIADARRYMLVDVENLTHGAKLTREQLTALWETMSRILGTTSADHIVIGAARSVARRYNGVINQSNVKWVLGANAPDAADRALLAAIDLRLVAREFGELVIVSGDHAFADLAHRAKKQGLRVQVITTERPLQARPTLAHSLSEAADTRTLLPLPRDPLSGTAPRMVHRAVGRSPGYHYADPAAA